MTENRPISRGRGLSPTCTRLISIDLFRRNHELRGLDLFDKRLHRARAHERLASRRLALELSSAVKLLLVILAGRRVNWRRSHSAEGKA